MLITDNKVKLKILKCVYKSTLYLLVFLIMSVTCFGAEFELHCIRLSTS